MLNPHEQFNETHKEINASNFERETDSSIDWTPFAYKRDYGSYRHRITDETSFKNELQLEKDKSLTTIQKPNIRSKANFKSIIATTAAIIIQNYWRNYRQHKLNHTENECGDTILENIRKQIETNTTTINDKAKNNFISSVSMVKNDQIDPQKQQNKNNIILKDVSVGSIDNDWVINKAYEGILWI